MGRSRPLKVAFVHGRRWAIDHDNKVTAVMGAIQTAFAHAGTDADLAALDVHVIDYSSLLDGMAQQRHAQIAADRHRQMVIPQFPVATLRDPRVELGHHAVACMCCARGGVVTEAWHGVAKVAASVDSIVHLTQMKLSDVETYVDDEHARSAVHDFVASEAESIRPDVVIAHSLGTIVTLDWLGTADEDVQPAALITMGSPIAVPEFQKTAIPQSTLDWMANPQSAWLNLWDPTDEVCGARGIEDSHLRHAIAAIANLRVNNHPGRVIADPHSVLAYLTHHPVGRWLASLAHPTHELDPRSAQQSLVAALGG